MKVLIVLVFLIVSNFSFGQIEKLKGDWVSEDNEFISIKDTMTTANYLTNKRLSNDDFYLSLKDDTISFQSRYFYSDNLKKMYTDRYDLKILTLNDSTLIVVPSSKNSISFFETEKPIKFIKQDYIRDDGFKFERIIFHASYCFGDCPEINLEINAKGEIKMNSVFFKTESSRDNDRSGSFKGKLDLQTFEELKKLIIQSKVVTLNLNDEMLCCDGAVKTIIVYFNGKRKFVRAMFTPAILGELISFLYRIDTVVKLEKSSVVFRFDE
ncbi:DUF6438 domain-containing protein [Flavobacterium tructae]|uniref:DUF6438 domain-containing protein n=1 Tax=Flavobacterium tructae TaxID=1114873 RepID=A0A1S1JBZ8_9FLAO|nr:DUF6438 domain-containing protein [Flavobacterium tructae]OHT47039.1 hypothetical protein BHE19_21885 [Flavobacterium tructae]OXB14399.1 hypothetical protein B0A71_21705 [Flavobacterium tructae]